MVAAIWSPGHWREIINIINRLRSEVVSQVCLSSLRSIKKCWLYITVLSEPRYSNNNNCHLFT